jgi:hypothetical protein
MRERISCSDLLYAYRVFRIVLFHIHVVTESCCNISMSSQNLVAPYPCRHRILLFHIHVVCRP